MSRGIAVAVIVVLLLALAAAGVMLLVYSGALGVAGGPAGVAATPAEAPRSITVVGMGKASAPADTAQLMAGLDVVAPTAKEAASLANEGIAKIMEALKAQGIDENDIQTSYFSVYPEMDYSQEGKPGTITGYRASTSLSVKIRDITKVGDILDQTTAAGANNIQGLNFTIDDSAPIEDQARQKAIADADRRAADLAKLMGVSVGRVISISEVIGGAIPFRAEVAMGMGGGGGGIAPGQLEITSQVEVTYAIQ